MLDVGDVFVTLIRGDAVACYKLGLRGRPLPDPHTRQQIYHALLHCFAEDTNAFTPCSWSLERRNANFQARLMMRWLAKGVRGQIID
jgi:hypothetical protein